jgi:branched-chain amino acid transport system ATP-binding protein
VYGDLSVTENLLLAQHQLARYDPASALLRLPNVLRVERELRERAATAIEALGFERYADTPVQNLSHGQQRIVEIGCLLVTAPEVLMLDEPSAGMAPALVENLAERLAEMRDELGKTILLIEHNVPLVLDVCDELWVLDAGRVLANGDPKNVVGRREVVDAYLGAVSA